MFYHSCEIVVLDAEVNPEMPRMNSKAVPEGNGPVFQYKSGLGGLTIEETRRIFVEEHDKSFDRWTRHFDHEIRLEDK